MSIKTTNARMQQLTGKWSDLNTDNLLVGEMAVPSDHNPVIKTGDNKIREIPLLEDMSEYETYIAQLRSAIDEANRLIDEVITKVGINDNEIGTTTTYSSSKIEERIGTIKPTAIINDTTASDKTVYSSNKVESKITETKNEIGESITTINNNITQITEDVSTLNSNKADIPTYDDIASYGGGIYSSDTSFTMRKNGTALIQVANWTDDTLETISVKINTHSVATMTPSTRYKRENLTVPVRNGDAINFSGMSVGTLISINLM